MKVEKLLNCGQQRRPLWDLCIKLYHSKAVSKTYGQKWGGTEYDGKVIIFTQYEVKVTSLHTALVYPVFCV